VLAEGLLGSIDTVGRTSKMVESLMSEMEKNHVVRHRNITSRDLLEISHIARLTANPAHRGHRRYPRFSYSGKPPVMKIQQTAAVTLMVLAISMVGCGSDNSPSPCSGKRVPVGGTCTNTTSSIGRSPMPDSPYGPRM
jgi:hypothetical protein